MFAANLPRANLLVLGSNSIKALVPATLSAQVESLLDKHKLPEAATLADNQRQKLQQRSVQDTERNELCYLYQCIGFKYLSETMFEDAGTQLFLGQLDPRVLISYFPELRGSLFASEDGADVFAGALRYMPQDASVDDLIQNYSPHLSPNTREAPVTAELRQQLRYVAEEMLERFLRNCRFQMRTGNKGKAKSTAISTAVDTVLTKIYAKTQKTGELHALIGEGSDIVLHEVEPVLLACEQYTALCRLYERENETEKLLNAWASLADGEWVDRHANAANLDPISKMEALLLQQRDRAAIAQWGVWLAHRDPERGFKLLLARDTGKRSKTQAAEDIKVLESLQDASPDAAIMFLEHLVLQRRSTDTSLHMRLAQSCTDELLACLQNEATHKLWKAKYASYFKNPPSSSFLSYFVSTTPDSNHKDVRIKTLLFLQGSSFYDAQVIRSRILSEVDGDTAKILSLEIAILDGKLLNHHRALSVLVHDLNDGIASETYCSLGGDVIPAKLAAVLAEIPRLRLWAALVAPSSGDGSLKQKVVDEDVRKSLIGVLLEVYMSGGETNSVRTAQLLNSQGMSLDALEVINSIPANWPLSAMSTFLNRSLRRTIHDKHEIQIMKNISMAQNLRVSEESWMVIREQGAVVEEADDSDDEDESVLEKPINEKGGEDVSVADVNIEGNDGERWYPTGDSGLR